jgi:hypothetical protein
MNGKAYFAGILTGAVCCLAGYLMAATHNPSYAAPGAASGDGWIMVSGSEGANEKMIYILNTSDATRPGLYVYGLEQGKDLTFRAFRNMAYDGKFDLYEMKGQPNTPKEMKDLWEKNGPPPQPPQPK